MTNILARILVRETYGIRRFLYPLSTSFTLPIDTDTDSLRLVTYSGEAVPSEVTSIAPDYTAIDGRKLFQIDFATSLDPFAEMELSLIADGRPFVLADPLRLTQAKNGSLENRQERFSVILAINGAIEKVVYDGISHLRASDSITRNGEPAPEGHALHRIGSFLWTIQASDGQYKIRPFIGDCMSHTSLTACKSWVVRSHWIQYPQEGDVIIFTLPLTVSALPLLCDFGVGGGIYGKIGAEDTVTWETEFNEDGPIRWSINTNGRMDYAGEVASLAEYHAQQWFHVIDKGKALAVAIVHVPDCCRTLTVTLNGMGDVQIAYMLGAPDDSPAEFGVCYHFLNDAPAIAAATNPQSILIPPAVEVLHA